MGNCQAIDAATLMIQHPNGKVDKLYSTMTASEVMKMNPGHYVALLLSTISFASGDQCSGTNPVRLTRIKLLRPTDTLVLGKVYKLITTQEVMKGLSAKKFAKMTKTQSDSAEKIETRRSEQKENQVTKQRTNLASPANSATTARSRTWLPKLQSISEAGSLAESITLQTVVESQRDRSSQPHTKDGALDLCIDSTQTIGLDGSKPICFKN